MARKRPSTHSEAQFALFIDRMNAMYGGDAGTEFDDAVRRLIGAVQNGPSDLGLDESDDLQEDGQLSSQEAAESASPSVQATVGSRLPPRPDKGRRSQDPR